ncbi:hypothetical protein Q4494_17605 [Celeribacter halophilus]|uniref:Transposase n=1 Tax=Celeribacter halophilus TaxID=576117 RepID=A0AAW7XZX1_9RHOB|nr:hypothetical protein [Celeribacter halophilus]MDO6458899.1 hypothetical protein [Celeribacter halophilus]
MTAAARRHGICRSLLTTWRRQYRNGELGSSRPLSFTPVSVTQSATTPQSSLLSSCPPPACQIEIALTNGRNLGDTGVRNSFKAARDLIFQNTLTCGRTNQHRL